MGRLTRTLLWRFGQAAMVTGLVATACFAGLQALPGDLALHVAAARYGEDRVSAGNVELLRRQAGLDRPVTEQYGAWMGRLALGDAGRSLLTGKPVLDELAPRLGVTLRIGGTAAALALLLALPLGIAAGLAPGGPVDRGVAVLAALLASVPSFVAGTLLVALLAVRLRWFPTSGNGSAAHMVLPAATLALALAPGLTRVARHAVASVARAPFTLFARMRGVPGWKVALQVAARPALIPVAAYLPVLAMHLIEGFVTVELVFNLDGIGTLLVRSLLGRDLPVVMGASIAFVLLMAAANALADLLLRLLDPRPPGVAALSHSPGAAHRRRPWFGIGLTAALAALAVLGPLLPAADPLAQDLGATFEPPGREWLLGTDHLGRSVLARAVAAAPLSLGVAAAASVATAVLGTAAGLLAATLSGVAGRAVMAVADTIYAVPALLLVLLAGGLFGGGAAVVLTGLVLARWPLFARTCHPLALQALRAPDAEASGLLGFGVIYRMHRHAWPAVRPVVVSLAALGVGANVLAVSSLGFLGIGLAPPRPEWGAMVADALPYLRDQPAALLAPAGALFLATLASTLVGEAWAAAPGAVDTAASAPLAVAPDAAISDAVP